MPLEKLAVALKNVFAMQQKCCAVQNVIPIKTEPINNIYAPILIISINLTQ